MQVNIHIDRSREERRLKRWADEALTDYRDEIIEDINQLVPVSGGLSRNGGGGSLQRSAFLHSDRRADKGKLTIRWNTPYAHYQHQGLVMHGNPGNRTYGPEKLSYTSLMARAEWTKHAEKIYGEDWARGIERLMGGK